MKNSSVKMIWQAIALVTIAFVAAAAALFSSRKAGNAKNNSSAVHTSQNTTIKKYSSFPVKGATAVEGKRFLHQQAGFIYVIF